MHGHVFVQFRGRSKTCLPFPEEEILVPQSFRSIPFAEMVPQLVAEFWHVVMDEIDGVPPDQPPQLQWTAMTINGRRAPKNGTISDLVSPKEHVHLVVTIAGADIYGIWVESTQAQTQAQVQVPPVQQEHVQPQPPHLQPQNMPGNQGPLQQLMQQPPQENCNMQMQLHPVSDAVPALPPPGMMQHLPEPWNAPQQQQQQQQQQPQPQPQPQPQLQLQPQAPPQLQLQHQHQPPPQLQQQQQPQAPPQQLQQQHQQPPPQLQQQQPQAPTQQHHQQHHQPQQQQQLQFGNLSIKPLDVPGVAQQHMPHEFSPNQLQGGIVTLPFQGAALSFGGGLPPMLQGSNVGSLQGVYQGQVPPGQQMDHVNGCAPPQHVLPGGYVSPEGCPEGFQGQSPEASMSDEGFENPHLGYTTDSGPDESSYTPDQLLDGTQADMPAPEAAPSEAAPEAEKVDVSASEAVEAVVNCALEFVNGKCTAPPALGGRPMFTAAWVAQKPHYVRVPGKKRGKYRPRTAEPTAEPTEEELERQRQFRRERAKAAGEKRWAMARELKAAVEQGQADPSVLLPKAKVRDRSEKQFRNMRDADPLPERISVPRLKRPGDYMVVMARVLAAHGGVGFTCSVCSAKLYSKESAVEHYRKSKRCEQQRTKLNAGGAIPPPPEGQLDPRVNGKSGADALLEASASTAFPDKTLSMLKVWELRQECVRRLLPTLGRKEELIIRILNDVVRSSTGEQLPGLMALPPGSPSPPAPALPPPVANASPASPPLSIGPGTPTPTDEQHDHLRMSGPPVMMSPRTHSQAAMQGLHYSVLQPKHDSDDDGHDMETDHPGCGAGLQHFHRTHSHTWRDAIAPTAHTLFCSSTAS